ncbi:hypothetical protein [Streptomyces sp. NPDC058045]
MEPSEQPRDAERGETYVLGGRLMVMPGLPSIRCVARKVTGTRVV